MSQIHPISFERHGKKQIKPLASWAFAANYNLAPLVVSEFAQADVYQDVAGAVLIIVPAPQLVLQFCCFSQRNEIFFRMTNPVDKALPF